jgi:hypothetical protein
MKRKGAMRTILFTAAMLLCAAGCEKKQATNLEAPRAAAARPPAQSVVEKKLFLDFHHFGPGKVNADAVAGAHAKDLAVQAKHGVKYLKYWFDAESGTVMCLAEAPSAEAALAVHKEAHGLMPDSIELVSEEK